MGVTVPTVSLPVFTSCIPKQAKSGNANPVKTMTTKQALHLFGRSEFVKMNFVPQMMTALVMKELQEFIDHCRKRRISEFKKHTRFLKFCIEGYAQETKDLLGPDGYRGYESFVAQYLEYIAVDRVRMLYSIGNVVSKQLPRHVDRDAATRIAIIHNLLLYIEKMEQKTDLKISETLDRPIAHRRNKMLLGIEVMCMEFEDTHGFKIEFDEMVEMNMRVMANRATTLADKML